MSLTTLSTVKEYLGLTGTGEDVLLNSLMDWARDFIHSHCGRIFPLGGYDEYIDGDGTETLLSHQFSILSVNSLEVDRVVKDSASFVLYAPLGLLKLKSGVFPRDRKSVV